MIPRNTRLVFINNKTLSIPETTFQEFAAADSSALTLFLVDPVESTRLLAEFFLKRKVASI